MISVAWVTPWLNFEARPPPGKVALDGACHVECMVYRDQVEKSFSRGLERNGPREAGEFREAMSKL